MKKLSTRLIFLTAFLLAVAGFSIAFPPAVSCQDGANPELAAAFDSLAAAYGSCDATTRLLTDNVESWYARWYVLNEAKKTIDVTSFIFDRDAYGMAFLGLLLKKAREGVAIRLMIDARGAGDLAKHLSGGQDLLQELVETKNVQVRVYNPLSENLLSMFVNPRNIVCSNHDKIIIIDGGWVITGGRNIARNYFADPRDLPVDNYEDTDVIMRHQAIAARMKKAFDDEFECHSAHKIGRELFGNWVSRAGELELARRAMEAHINGMPPLDPSKIEDGREREFLAKVQNELFKYARSRGYSNYKPFQGDRTSRVVVLDKHSFKGTLNEITPAVMKLIAASKKEIIIQNPYFVVTDEAMKALSEANGRGVPIFIQTNSPDTSEKPMTLAFFVNEWQKVLFGLSKARLFAFHGQGKLHSKVFVFDREVTVVGSYNMDPMSEQINSEIAVAIQSKTFSLRSTGRILESVRKSAEYKLKYDKAGKVVPAFGPEFHSNPEVMKKLQMIYRLWFLRPLV